MTREQKRLLPVLVASIAAVPAPLILRGRSTPESASHATPLALPTPMTTRTLHPEGPPRRSPTRLRQRPIGAPAPRRPMLPDEWRLALLRSEDTLQLVVRPGRSAAPGPWRLYLQDQEVARAPSGVATLLSCRLPQHLPPGLYTLRDGAGRRMARYALGSPTYQRHARARFREAIVVAARALRNGKRDEARRLLRRLKSRYRVPLAPDLIAALEEWLAWGRPGSYEVLIGTPKR